MMPMLCATISPGDDRGQQDDHVELDRHLQALGHDAVVLGQQYLQSVVFVWHGSGTLAKTVVPSPGLDVSRKVPPTSRTRSSMLTRPR